jgi:two-component system, LytTR family, response regulator LytT
MIYPNLQLNFQMNNNLNILIIEDELLISAMLKEMLLELGYSVIGVAKNFAIASSLLEEKTEINFAIVDINLNEKNTGIDIAKKINEDYKIPFIFLTSYSDKQTFQEALVCKPEAYLIKPFSKIDLYTTLELVKAKNRAVENIIIIKEGHLTIKLEQSSIQWIKSENVYVEIKTLEKKYLIRNTLEGFLEELNNNRFLRIHRSFAVNVSAVKAVNGQYVIVNNEKIPLSRKYRDEVLLQFSSK